MAATRGNRHAVDASSENRVSPHAIDATPRPKIISARTTACGSTSGGGGASVIAGVVSQLTSFGVQLCVREGAKYFPIALHYTERTGVVGVDNSSKRDFAVDADMLTAGEDVRVTLAWDDVAAALQNPLAGAALVNDLDLVLIDPNGTAHYPWQLGHTIRDAAGNIIPTANQAPGTQVLVDLPFRDEAGIANAVDNTSITLTTTPSTSNDNTPTNAMTGAGAWVATKERDHINNVEVVDIDNINPR